MDTYSGGKHTNNSRKTGENRSQRAPVGGNAETREQQNRLIPTKKGVTSVIRVAGPPG